ncbi:ribosomal protein L15 [Coniochaeta ligniaria NRRL 30616]|uniref:Ribosomal protein L15 n=1 Tax=Coniochaeta ligniaria NRRL 30616 TaxID=1408157 RepID=A0A1J7I5J0_9PEZI|nr:ribosomal protein L15 [Coniochaeta ligniaria NRRL 30616]
MPPRLPLSAAARCCRIPLASAETSSPLISLFAALSIQTRSASILANLSENKGAHQKRIRVGRGPSSGYGKTSGRGHKGQGQHGKVNARFQGGQTPLAISKGRKGFENLRAPEMAIVNLDRLQAWVDAGRLDPTKKITPRELIKSGIMGRSLKDGITLLARGKSALKTPLDIIVSRASESAIEAVEAAGGKIVTRYFTKESLKRLAKGESVITDKPLPVGPEHVDAVLEQARSGPHYYRLPDPTSRWDIEYYRDPAHRGYLSHQLAPGESPSLYFKVPGETKKIFASKAKQQEKLDVDKLF